MAVTKRLVYKKNSQYIEVTGLKDKSVTPSTYVNSATGTGTLYDATDTPVVGATNITVLFVPSSNGVYRFDFDPVLFDPPVASNYIFKATLTSGSKVFHIELPVSVLVRKEGTET